MDVNLLRLIVFVGGLGVMLLMETLWPCRAWETPRGRRLVFHLGLSVINNVILRLTVFGPLLYLSLFVIDNNIGLLRLAGLNGAENIIAGLIIMDGLDYWWHRFNHTIPFLWRFHKVHHVDTHVDTTTSLRFHPGELLISAVVKAGWIVLLGPEVLGFLIFEVSVTLFSQFHHSNIDLPDRAESVARSLIVTPRFHAAHHTVTPRTGNANYSAILIFWDKLFGTYNEPDYEEMEYLGLAKGRESYLSLRETLKAPFTSAY
jgi:sterol desaturase/sphingolipid hydroxylase (fatty acid hydroxylase superfamily)